MPDLDDDDDLGLPPLPPLGEDEEVGVGEDFGDETDFADQVTRSFKVQPLGFPVEQEFLLLNNRQPESKKASSSHAVAGPVPTEAEPKILDLVPTRTSDLPNEAKSL